jgi:hypothetical protein
MDFMTFVILLVSVIGNILLVTVFLCLYKLIPRTAMLMIRKRLGMGGMRDAMLALVCYDDGVGVVKPMTVKSEGCLEYLRKDGTSETYYIAKPKEDTGDAALDRANYELDRITLPSLSVDGIPLALCYSLDGVAVNANTLLALQLASRVSDEVPNSFMAAIKTPDPAAPRRKGSKLELAKHTIKVLLPINPLDIHRAFKHYWDQSMLDASQQRNQNLGAAKAGKNGKDHFKFLVIIGLVACIGLAVAGVVVGRLIG